jgi:RNA polymerase sigma-70 factor (sigma-E family)
MSQAWDGGTVTVARTQAWSADEAVTYLFGAHYRPLVRLAVLLVDDPGAAEELVQDAFVRLHQNWRRLREPDKALAYLRATVVNGGRSALRRRGVARRYAAAEAPPPDVPSAESSVLGSLAQQAMLAALRRLPGRQREALVLRYYADLSEAEIADVMGISRGAVKSHTARGVVALRQSLERQS